MSPPLRDLHGWGRRPVVRGDERSPEDLEAGSADVELSRGLGRSYGDASLPAREGAPVLGTTRGDAILAFDPASGVLRAEAGFSLRALNRIFPPRGWAAPVSPGTQYVTLGGLVAADVHGKNHVRAGSFGAHVRALRLRVGDGRVLEVSEESEPELFRATLGGLGLTGHVLEVELALERIPSFWIWRRSERVGSLEELLAGLAAAREEWPFSVAWFDTTARGAELGRGIVNLGRWAEPDEAPSQAPVLRERIAVPFDLPGWVVAPWSIRPFNALYFAAHGARAKEGVVHPQPFFYPLDAVRDWNRLYGRRGMVQYQCVVPFDAGAAGLRRLLERVAAAGAASPVSVIKELGAEGRGMLSFPMPGLTLALDLPYRAGASEALVDALNEELIGMGGRIYLAKDALTRREHYARMDPRLPRWNAVREKWDPDRRLASALSRRLLDPAS